MRDRERRETPIVPNEIIPVQWEDGTVGQYGGWVDSIHMFSESRLTHVKFWTEDGRLSFQFLEQDILAQLAERGLPVVPRTHIYEREVEAHKEHCWAMAEALGQIPVRSMTNCVELEEHVDELSDAEISYFLEEWSEER